MQLVYQPGAGQEKDGLSGYCSTHNEPERNLRFINGAHMFAYILYTLLHELPVFNFSFFIPPPPGSVCWWGPLRRTPPSLASWRLELSTTAPGLDSLTAAGRYRLTVPVSSLKTFKICSRKTWKRISDL